MKKLNWKKMVVGTALALSIAGTSVSACVIPVIAAETTTESTTQTKAEKQAAKAEKQAAKATAKAEKQAAKEARQAAKQAELAAMATITSDEALQIAQNVNPDATCTILKLGYKDGVVFYAVLLERTSGTTKTYVNAEDGSIFQIEK